MCRNLCIAVPWCSGYHVSLTHSRSWVRSPAEPLFFLMVLDQNNNQSQLSDSKEFLDILQKIYIIHTHVTRGAGKCA